MGGLGIGEVLLIGLIVGFMGIALFTGIFGIGSLTRGGRGSAPELQAQILEELRSLRYRLDIIEDRMDRARIAGSGDAGGTDGPERGPMRDADHE